MNLNTLSIGDETYDIASDEARIATEFIERVWRKAGRPRILEGESAWKVVDAIMKVWMGLYPQELKDWKANLKQEQYYERSVHDANKAEGGYFPISYPTTLFNLLRIKFPGIPLADHSLIKEFITRYPILKITKHKV